MNKTILMLLLILAFSFVNYAQSSGKALKFDVITDHGVHSFGSVQQLLEERGKRLASHLGRDRSKKIYIIFYRARVSDFRSRWFTRSSSYRLINQLPYNFSENIHVIDGGVRHSNTFEIWIAPTNADPPAPTPEFEESEAIDCPSISIYSTDLPNNRPFDKKKPMRVHASITPESTDIEYNWATNGGEIIYSNKSWSDIQIDTSSNSTGKISVFVELQNVPMPCNNRAYAVFEVGNVPRLIDEFGLMTNGEMRARMDQFLITLMNNPETKGYVHIYGNRTGNDRVTQARKNLLQNHVTLRKFDQSRIEIIDAGFDENILTKFWMVPEGVEPPKPNPSVDSSLIKKPAPRPTARRRR